MLLPNQSLSVGSITGFVLTTGDQIVGRIVQVERTDIFLDSPSDISDLKITWPVGRKNNVVIVNRTSIVSFFDVNDDIKDEFVKRNG